MILPFLDFVLQTKRGIYFNSCRGIYFLFFSCILNKSLYSITVVLQGGVWFPTGGKVRDLHLQPSRCDSDTNSIVWMKEERVWRFSSPVQMYRAFLFMICMCLYSFLTESVGAAHRFIDVNRFSYWRKNQTMRRNVNSFLRERREKWKTKTTHC